MTARATALLCVAAGLFASVLFGWSTFCERYAFCYPSCRVAANGVEYWKTVPSVSAKSEWIAAGQSPGSECLALLAVVQDKYPGKQVVVDYVNLANERKPAAFYQYDCTFEIKEPVFALARNRECPTQSLR